jgi:cytochrome c2
MRYEAVALLPLLREAIKPHKLDPRQAEVRFVCKDGYAPSSSLADVLAAEAGYIAYRDLSQPPDKNWPDSLAAAYAPFYLVWANVPKTDHHLPWPFGLVRIEVRAHSETYLRFFPQTRPELVEGYELFVQNCQKCHALAGIGGEMGPDFHGPKNITEYWQRKDLIAFAQHPQSYRQNSKMPAIRHLSPAQLGKIVDYLQQLAQEK